MLSIDIDRARRTIIFRANGTVTLADLEKVNDEAKRVFGVFKGGRHIVLADMRGMTVLSPEVAQAFGELIRYGRENGTTLCAHLSDSSIARLQAARLAREVNPQDAVTVNVVSLEEANRLINERYPTL